MTAAVVEQCVGIRPSGFRSDAWDRGMLDRLRELLKLDAVVPVVLIVAALLMTLEPTILGVGITERQILLAFFGFLGIDALIERTGRLRRIERRLETVAEQASGRQAAGQVLRARSSFERMDVLVAQARRSVLIIGVNLEGALGCAATLAALARSGGTVRLLAMDPHGSALAPSATTSGVDPALRRGKTSRTWNSSVRSSHSFPRRPCPRPVDGRRPGASRKHAARRSGCGRID
jgi:hypothetical protein